MKGILDLIKIVAVGAMIMVVIYMIGIFTLVAMML